MYHHFLCTIQVYVGWLGLCGKELEIVAAEGLKYEDIFPFEVLVLIVVRLGSWR